MVDGSFCIICKLLTPYPTSGTGETVRSRLDPDLTCVPREENVRLEVSRLSFLLPTGHRTVYDKNFRFYSTKIQDDFETLGL